MYSVYQHWDPLKNVVVGRAYPPEFFSFIKNSKLRNHFEALVNETEEDYQTLIKLLNRFGVTVQRPQLPDDLDSLFVGGKWVLPPTAPRDYFITIGEELWLPTIPNCSHAWTVFYRDYQQPEWPWFDREQDFVAAMPDRAADMLAKFETFKQRDQLHLDSKLKFYDHIFDDVRSNGGRIIETDIDFINGCFVSRIGQDLYFATQTYHDDQTQILTDINKKFTTTRNHVVNAGGHGDATYCPVTPGLIISLRDIPTYQDTFPDWEVVYLPPSDYQTSNQFKSSMKYAKGRWFIPGFEGDNNLVNLVDHYFSDWVGQVSETVFDVNILVIDPKNIVVSSHSDRVEAACARYGITVHVVPFRHRYFWDAGIHCVTNDLAREGTRQDFFPGRLC
jgi:hypothetical protein